jgi:hypothetical protein
MHLVLLLNVVRIKVNKMIKKLTNWIGHSWNVLGSDNEDRWVELDEFGHWEYQVTKGTGGKKVHFYVTVTETDQPLDAGRMWSVEFDCNCNNQHKSAIIETGEKHEMSVDTNFWSDTNFTFKITSTKGDADKNILVHLVTKTTS